MLILGGWAVSMAIGAVITGVAARRKPDQTRREMTLAMVGITLASVTLAGVLVGVLSLVGELTALDRRANQTLRRMRPASAHELTILRNKETQRVLALGSYSAAPTIAAQSQRGRAALREKHWQTCAEAYGRVLYLDNGNYEALANQAVCLFELDLVDGALGRVLDAIARIPDPGLYFVAGSCYVKKEDKRRALAWLATAVKGGFTNLGMIQRNYGPYRTDPAYIAIVASLR